MVVVDGVVRARNGASRLPVQGEEGWRDDLGDDWRWQTSSSSSWEERRTPRQRERLPTRTWTTTTTTKPPCASAAAGKRTRRSLVRLMIFRVSVLAMVLATNEWVRRRAYYCRVIGLFAGTTSATTTWCDGSSSVAGELSSSTAAALDAGSGAATAVRTVTAAAEPVGRHNVEDAHWPPRQCTASEFQTIQLQLPDDICREHERKPWTNRCHLSFVTRCPDSTWLTSHYVSIAQSLVMNEGNVAKQNDRSDKKRTVVYVGCNKGMDAVNALRMVSNDPTIDKVRWRQEFFANTTVQPGHCNQEFEEQFPIVDRRGKPGSAPATTTTVVNAQALCLEAMPVTARHIARTAQQLGWHDRFKVIHAAVSNELSWALFPNPVDHDLVGVEGLGMDVCAPRNRRDSASHKHDAAAACANVTVTTLDILLANKPGHVDVLSIDVEGYDFNVLLGAQHTLPRVRYLEFEYNWKKPWGSQSLQQAMEYLEPLGFVCYWAGSKERVWRITKCWRDAYNMHFWSNVACVNGNDESVRPVALQLERMFQETVKKGTELALQIDQEFRAFYSDVVRGYMKKSDGQLQFTDLTTVA